MRKFFSKIRQVFNIFIITALIGAASSVFVYFSTTPEQRGESFWVSAAFIAFAMITEMLMLAGISMRVNGGKNIPIGFSKVIIGGIYFVFTIVLAFWNARSDWTSTQLMIRELGGLIAFLTFMGLFNMAELKLSDGTTKEQAAGMLNLLTLSSKMTYIAADMNAAGMSKDAISQALGFSETLKYSDPSPASGRLEYQLEKSIDDIDDAVKSGDVQRVVNAIMLAERALKERNDYVKNSK